MASNPGRITLNPFRYFLHRPLWPAAALIAFLIFTIISVSQLSSRVKASPARNATATNRAGGTDPVFDRFSNRLSQPRGGNREAFPSSPVASQQVTGKLTDAEKKAKNDFIATLLLPLVPIIAFMIYMYGSLRHFMRGDGNPGVVVSLDPTLIAVATDLNNSSLEHYPVVKVVQTKLKRSRGEELKTGSIVGTVAQYSAAAAKADHFADFDPVPADLATGNEGDLSSLLASFDKNHYQQLVASVSRLPQPYQPGLFYLGDKEIRPMPTGLFSGTRGLFSKLFSKSKR